MFSQARETEKNESKESEIYTLGAGLSPRDGVDAEGSVKPTAGSKSN